MIDADWVYRVARMSTAFVHACRAIWLLGAIVLGAAYGHSFFWT